MVGFDLRSYVPEVEVDAVALVKGLDEPADIGSEDPSQRQVFGATT